MSHSFTNILIHAVFSTKDRHPIIDESFRQRLHAYMGGIARDEFVGSIEVGGTHDHVHGLLILPATMSVALAMSKWKSLSSGWVNKLPERHGAAPFGWQNGYGAFSVSQSLAPTVARYIQRQMEHHQHQTFEEEFMELLRLNGQDFDPTTIWD